MLFNSFDFILFLPIVILLYYGIKAKYRWMMLLAASYYFYMCWRVEYVVLIVASTLLDYAVARKMQSIPEKKNRRKYLWLSLAGNLGLLFTFKYFDFFLFNVESLSAQFNIFYDSPVLNVLLPMGISFYTFQTLSYTIDVYKGKAKAEKHFGYFALYVTYFPQLVAGPIERASNLLPQLRRSGLGTKEDFRYGINKILLGFFKKVVVADNIGMFCDQLFAYPVHGSGLVYAFAITLFTIQLFADFSGYSDIAIGTARLMGVNLMENFNRPFKSSTMSDFWSKWHVSLTSWIGDYVFKPLLMKYKKYSALLTIFIMTLIGFWHGASWNFIIFGLLHGIIIVSQRYYKKIKFFKPFNRSKVGKNIFIVWNFLLLVLTGVFFRNDFSNSILILKHIFTDIRFNLNELKSPYQSELMIAIFLSLLCWATVYFNKHLKFKYNFVYVSVMLAIILLFGLDNQNQFIYFQF